MKPGCLQPQAGPSKLKPLVDVSTPCYIRSYLNGPVALFEYFVVGLSTLFVRCTLGISDQEWLSGFSVL